MSNRPPDRDLRKQRPFPYDETPAAAQLERSERRRRVRQELSASREDLDVIIGAPSLSDSDEARAQAGQARRVAARLFGEACAAYVQEFSKAR